MCVAINAGERPRAAAFGSDPRPFLESANGLRPLPAAAAFGRFQGRSLFEVKQEKTVALASAGIGVGLRNIELSRKKIVLIEVILILQGDSVRMLLF